MTRYLVDSNVFIQAKNSHYGFDFCPAFWDWLVSEDNAGKVASIEKVREELRAGGDELSTWADGDGRNLFEREDGAVVNTLEKVSAWSYGAGYDTGAIATFLGGADYWLVAHALAHGFTVVTHEVRSSSKRRIKIPDACAGLGIACASPYEMLRRERAWFVLGKAPAQPMS